MMLSFFDAVYQDKISQHTGMTSRILLSISLARLTCQESLENKIIVFPLTQR